VIVALAPFASVPTVHTTALVHVPCVDVAETNVTVAGSVSVTVTTAAALGPAVATVRMSVRFCPANTGSGASLLMIERLAEGLTVVVTGPEVLFPGTGSLVALDTIAVLVSVPSASGVTTIVTVAVAPLAMGPRLHVTVPPDIEQVPWLAVTEPNVTVVGRVSDTVTPEAEFDP
jgi:hypothetical protein